MAGTKNAKAGGIAAVGLLGAIVAGSILGWSRPLYTLAFFAAVAVLYFTGVVFVRRFKPAPKPAGIKDSLSEQAKHKPVEMEPFWMPGIYTYYGDWYEWAVKHSQTIDFLLGKGLYYKPVDHKEWCGQHEPYNAFWHLEHYAVTHGNEKMLKPLAKDIETLLQRAVISTEHFYFVVRYIELYFEAHAMGRLLTPWQLSPQIRQGISGNIEKFMHLYGTQGGPFDCRTPRNEHYTQQTLRAIGRIKEKFGVDLLHV